MNLPGRNWLGLEYTAGSLQIHLPHHYGQWKFMHSKEVWHHQMLTSNRVPFGMRYPLYTSSSRAA